MKLIQGKKNDVIESNSFNVRVLPLQIEFDSEFKLSSNFQLTNYSNYINEPEDGPSTKHIILYISVTVLATILVSAFGGCLIKYNKKKKDCTPMDFEHETQTKTNEYGKKFNNPLYNILQFFC